MQTPHNPPTGESAPLFLLPNESTEDYADIQRGWTKDIPGTSHSILTLREDLIRADWQRRRARTIFQQLQLDLYLTGLPMQYWDRFTLRQFHFLEKHAARTQNEFRKAFQLVNAVKLAQAKPAHAKPEDPPPPLPRPNSSKPLIHQTVRVSIVDGKTVILAEPDSQSLIRPNVQQSSSGIWRIFEFKDKVVPEEYAYVMEHDDIYYGPTTNILISYRNEDFSEICARELEANTGHLLDGRRWSYHRLDDKDPIERPK